MNRKQKIIVSVTGIFIVLLILVGLTYAYFLTRIQGNTNTKSISVTTADLKLTYGDGTNQVLAPDTKLLPGSDAIGTKDFTVTNEGNSKTSYVVVIEDVSITKDGATSTFESNDFRYTLTCTKKDGTNCDGVSSQSVFPINGGVLVTNNIDVSDTQTYTLTLWYIDTGIDQSNDMGKTYNAKVNIKDTDSLTLNNPYRNETDTLKKTIIDNAMIGTGSTKMGSEVTTFTKVSGENDKLLNTAPDDYGTSYYYYGAVTDNYVSFANKLWRIVRINGDGSIRLVLDDVAKDSSGSVIETEFNPNFDDNAYVGYMYGTTGSTTYDETHRNINDSTIKTNVDKWYEDNLKTNYANYLSDTLFCNDKTLSSSGIGEVTTQLGYGANRTFYSTTERLEYSTGTTDITTAKPTFKCAESATNDYSRFTVNVITLPNGNKTNGNLTYPVGLLTADEVSFAGAYKSGQTNKSCYLYNSSISSRWWLSSPDFYGGSTAFEWVVYASYGYFGSNDVVNSGGVDPVAFRPSINLKAETLVSQGDGTKSNPYVIK